LGQLGSSLGIFTLGLLQRIRGQLW